MDDAALRAELAKLTDAADKLSFQSSASAGAFERVGKSLGMTSEQISKTTFGIKQIYSGAISFNRSLTSSEVSFSKYSSTVSQVTSGMSSIFSALGPMGQALGAVTEVLGKLVTSVFDQNDQYLSAFDTLAKFGYAGTGTAEALFDISKNTGYVGDKVGELAAITTGLGNDLTYLGKTSGEGVKTFFDIATITKAQRAEQIRLGYSQKEVTQNQADFIKSQTKLGILRTKDLTTLRNNSLNYGKQLMELAALTGQTPEMLKKGQEEDENDYSFNILLREQGKKAGKDYQKEIDRLKKGVSTFGADFPPLRKGFRDLLSRSQAATSDEALQMVQATGGAVRQWVEQYKRGEIDITKFNELYSQAMEKTIEERGASLTQNKDLATAVGVSGETMRGMGKDRVAGTEELVKRQTDAAMQPQAGGLKETQIKLLETELEVQTAFQTLVKLLADYVNPGFEGLLKGLDKLTGGLMETLTYLNVVDPEMPYIFKDAGELSRTLVDRQGKLAELYKERERSTNANVMGVDVSGPVDTAKKAYVDAQIKLQEREIDAIKKTLKKLTGSDRPLPTSSSTSSSSSGQGGGDYSADKAGASSGNINYGISSGPISGYTEKLNDQLQAVVPLPDGKSIPVSFKNLPNQLTSKRKNPLLDSGNMDGYLSGYQSSITNNLNQINNSLNYSPKSDDKSSLINLVSSKMDTLLDNITKNNQLQNDMLVYLRR